MSTLSSLSDPELLAKLPFVVRAERAASADVIAHLAELDRRRLYLEQACSSLYSFCIERLGYSEEAALKRVRVARLVQRFPHVLAELARGAVHMTGLYLLSQHLTDDNAEALLADARGKTRREIETMLARRFPRPDVPPTISPLVSTAFTLPEKGDLGACTASVPATTPKGRLEPLSTKTCRVEFTAGMALWDKIELARNLSSHAIPTGDLAALVERAFDTLIVAETKRRQGAGKPRKPRPLKPGSRHVPVDVARAVWERDESQCSFVDGAGRRCSARHFLTLEHRKPFALGGTASVENLCLLCAPHNQSSARRVFGAAHVTQKRAEADVFQKTMAALVSLGFERKEAKGALEAVRGGTCAEAASVEPTLRAALTLLVKEPPPPRFERRRQSRAPASLPSPATANFDLILASRPT